MSNSWSRASAAKRRASRGPSVASTSTSQPPPRSVSRTAVTARASVRAAAGLVTSSARVTLVPPLPEQVDAHLALVGRVLLDRDRTAAAADGLEARLGAPFRADAVLQARTQRVGHADLLALAESRVEHEERLVADLPPGGQLRARGRIGRVAGAELEVVERHTQVRDHRAFQLPRDEARGGAAHQRPLPSRQLEARPAAHEVRDDLALRQLLALRGEREARHEQRAANVRDDRLVLLVPG